MKRWIVVAVALLMTVTLAACGQTGTSQTPAAESSFPGSTESSSLNDPENPTTASAGNVLVAYFSWSGNTQEMASYIAEQTGGGLVGNPAGNPLSRGLQ